MEGAEKSVGTKMRRIGMVQSPIHVLLAIERGNRPRLAMQKTRPRLATRAHSGPAIEDGLRETDIVTGGEQERERLEPIGLALYGDSSA